MDVLLVDRDAVLAGSMEKSLAGLGHHVTVADTANRAAELVDGKPPGLAVVASRAPEDASAAEQIARHLGARGVPFVVTSSAPPLVSQLVPLGPAATLLEPFRDGELELTLAVLEAQLTRRRQSEVRTRLLNSIVEGLLDSVFVVDSGKQIIFANATARRQLQIPEESLDGRPLQDFFPSSAAGNDSLYATVDSALKGSAGIGSGSRATLQIKPGQTVAVVVIAQNIRDGAGNVMGAAISFRPAATATAAREEEPEPVEAPAAAPDTPEAAGDAESSHVHVQNTPLRAKAIRSIEAGLNADSTHKNYVVVLLLSQFDMFRLRYGLNNAEKLVHAFSAHLIKSLPPEDRLYTWSNRTVVVLLERESGIDEVRLEMTAFCSRRVDYYLNATGRSALVTLSASWHLIPLFDCPDARRDPRKIVEQIDAFERLHTRRK